MNPAAAALVVLLTYLAVGAGFATWAWREISDGADDGRTYWRAVAFVVLAWPKMLHDIRRR